MVRYVFKVLLAGAGGIGKTTLMHKYQEGQFIPNTPMTIGIEHFKVNHPLGKGSVSLDIWDFGGQQRFRWILDSFTSGAKGAILLFDLTRLATLEGLEEWIQIVRKHDPNLPILFVGTKSDLVEDIAVPDDYAEDYLKSLNLFDYIKISSKTGHNVKESIEKIVRKILERQCISEESLSQSSNPFQSFVSENSGVSSKIYHNSVEEQGFIYNSYQERVENLWHTQGPLSLTLPYLDVYHFNSLYEFDFLPIDSFLSKNEDFLNNIIQGYQLNIPKCSYKPFAMSYILNLKNQLFALTLNYCKTKSVVDTTPLYDFIQQVEPISNYHIQDLYAICYLLMGIIYLNKKDDNNASNSFLYAADHLIRINNLLAAKCYCIGSSLIAKIGNASGYKFIEQRSKQYEYLAISNKDYTQSASQNMLESQDQDSPLKYLLLSTRYFMAVDPSIYDKDVLVPLYRLVEPSVNSGFEDKILFSCTKNFLSQFEKNTLEHLQFNEITIQPPFPDSNDSIIVRTSIMNITSQDIECTCGLLAPKADRPESKIKIKLTPQSVKSISFLVGKANSIGKNLYFLEFYDTTGNMISQKEFPLYLRDPKELINFKDIHLDSDEIRQDEPLNCRVNCENRSKTTVQCVINLTSDYFKIQMNQFIFKIPPNSTHTQEMGLGSSDHIGEVFIEFSLMVDNMLCDSNRKIINIKRSYAKIFKSVAKNVIMNISQLK